MAGEAESKAADNEKRGRGSGVNKGGHGEGVRSSRNRGGCLKREERGRVFEAGGKVAGSNREEISEKGQKS